jgi:hypothetical protein
MADEESTVRIVGWPEEPARLEHRFDMEGPFPVSVGFQETPAQVIVASSQERPLFVEMLMNVVVKDVIPLCIRVCEPICARSDYTIGITIFDRPVASITVRGTTRVFNCNEER